MAKCDEQRSEVPHRGSQTYLKNVVHRLHYARTVILPGDRDVGSRLKIKTVRFGRHRSGGYLQEGRTVSFVCRAASIRWAERIAI